MTELLAVLKRPLAGTQSSLRNISIPNDVKCRQSNFFYALQGISQKPIEFDAATRRVPAAPSETNAFPISALAWKTYN